MDAKDILIGFVLLVLAVLIILDLSLCFATWMFSKKPKPIEWLAGKFTVCTREMPTRIDTTRGKEYQIISAVEGAFLIVNDFGNQAWYNNADFLTPYTKRRQNPEDQSPNSSNSEPNAQECDATKLNK